MPAKSQDQEYTHHVCQQPIVPDGLPGSQCEVATVLSHVSSLYSYHPEAAIHRTNQIMAYTPEDVTSDNGDVAACIHSDLTQSVATTINGT